MSGAIEVRRLGPPEAEHYRAIRLAMLEAEPAFFGASFEAEAALPRADFAERLAASVAFGAYAGTEIVGTIRLVRETAPKEIHKAAVRSFFVRPEFRGQGIGSALMAALIEAAPGHVEQLTLAVMAENRTAIALYERFGFVIYGVEPRSRKSAEGYADKALMALILQHAPSSPAGRGQVRAQRGTG